MVPIADSMKVFDAQKTDEYRIENHGIIGDTYSSALVTVKGTIDWCCFPVMDSPAVFSSILDRKKGGEMRVELRNETHSMQRYVKNTNVLKTELSSPDGKVVITDYMPVETDIEKHHNFIYSRHEIHRLIECVKGNADIDVIFRPRFNFGTSRTRLEKVKGGVVASHGKVTLSLSGLDNLYIDSGSAVASLRMAKGKKIALIVRWAEDDPALSASRYTTEFLQKTVDFWRRWASESCYRGKWRDSVLRSALALKLLTYSPTGAICAAATTSLPESIGHGRNWDYRYSWIRDSTYALSSFNLIGHRVEEETYFMWLLHLLRGRASMPEKLRVMYTIEGDPVPDEHEISALSGYDNSKPVRIGNGATGQIQIDIFGPIVDAIYFTYYPFDRMPDLMWRFVKSIADYTSVNWDRPDMGIWEMRNGRRRHTHSAVMSWMAIDRAAVIAKMTGRIECWQKWRNISRMMRKQILERSYDDGKGYFSGLLDDDWLDASVLVLPDTGFIDARSTEFRKTLQTIGRRLMDNGLLRRYEGDDGIEGDEGAFVLCTFWYIEALFLSGQKKAALRLFELTMQRANHLGLFSEEIDPQGGGFLGNFPQAFSHLGMIKTACVLQSKRLMNQKPKVNGLEAAH